MKDPILIIATASNGEVVVIATPDIAEATEVAFKVAEVSHPLFTPRAVGGPAYPVITDWREAMNMFSEGASVDAVRDALQSNEVIRVYTEVEQAVAQGDGS